MQLLGPGLSMEQAGRYLGEGLTTLPSTHGYSINWSPKSVGRKPQAQSRGLWAELMMASPGPHVRAAQLWGSWRV